MHYGATSVLASSSKAELEPGYEKDEIKNEHKLGSRFSI
ncbi:hypothetical protein LMxysn_0785 [Listeria monocytogenes]|nr:hypothetical protein LMxysn_0785 [Listeria monocytogenes]